MYTSDWEGQVGQRDILFQSTFLWINVFLVACTWLYAPLCRSVSRSIGPSVGNTLLFIVISGYFKSIKVILSHLIHFKSLLFIFSHFSNFSNFCHFVIFVLFCLNKSSYVIFSPINSFCHFLKFCHTRSFWVILSHFKAF